MTSTTIQIPSFNFAGFYYGEIYEALLVYKRLHAPELTDESDVEPAIQFLKAYSLVGHLNNVNMDVLANENTLPTAQLAETVRNMLRLIDYELRPASPAQADIVYQLSRIFTAPTEIIPSEGSQVATKKINGGDSITYEILSGLIVQPTDDLGWFLADENGVFTDYTIEANLPVGFNFTPWVTPAVGDAIYIGHENVMWDKFTINLDTFAANIIGVWEFYDGDFRKTAPTSVTDNGSTLEFDLTSLLGTNNRQGTKIRVQLNSTVTYEDVYSTWSGTKNIATTSLLGQSSPSVLADDYTIGSDWTIIDDVIDSTSDLTASGDVEYTLPQTVTKNWIIGEVDGNEAYWLRYRIVIATTPTAPIFEEVKIGGKQYILKQATQGETVTEDPLGSSNGLDDQEFLTGKENFIWDSETVTVDSVDWTRVENFLNSSSGDEHYVIKLGTNDRATVLFGGNGKGKIPPVGSGNIKITYRYGGTVDGNVGPETITISKSGLAYTDKVWNPRQAVGWSEAEGATEESLEAAKIEGPASLRVVETAISPDDVADMTKRYQDVDGSYPFSRATGFEEGFGPKTIELVVVARGGGLSTVTQLENLDEYFNGDKYSSPPKRKRVISNQEVVSVNYEQKAIDITATVYGEITKEAVENQLTRLLQPEAKKENGVDYEWEFGGVVEPSRINHEIFAIDDEVITNVVVTTPSSTINLNKRELPVVGTLSITIVEP